MKILFYLLILFGLQIKAQTYEVFVDTKHQTIYTPEAIEKYFGDIKDLDSRKWNVEQNSNPPVLNFKIYVNKEKLNILELDKINNSQDGMGTIRKSVPNLPFGFSYVNYSDNYVLRPVDVYGKKYIEKAVLQELDWKFENEFKEILGYKAQKATSKYMDFVVTIWVTKEITADFMPAYNIKPIKGFVLEMFYVIENEAGEMINSINVISLKEIKDYKFKTLSDQLNKKVKVVSSAELDDIYDDLNNKRNQMMNQESTIDKK